jgi:ketosteroid isomerase-like protein
VRILSDEKLATLQRLVEAVGRGDVEAALDELHPEVEIDDTDIPDADDYRGHDAFLAWVSTWDESWASWRVEDLAVRSVGTSEAVALFKMIVTGKGSGIELDRNDAVLATVRDNKIAKLGYYNDQEKALAAAGSA